MNLGCPIVGDHKYEHAAEIRPPQKLPGACLNRLGIRQAQVRGRRILYGGCGEILSY